MTLKQQLTVSIFAALALAATGKTYPDLPVALADGGGALIGDIAYVGLGSAEDAFFALDLKTPQARPGRHYRPSLVARAVSR
jgi:N-acetylneuraminate epimerase